MRGTSVAMHLWMLDGMESEVLLDMLDRDEKKKQIIINSLFGGANLRLTATDDLLPCIMACSCPGSTWVGWGCVE